MVDFLLYGILGDNKYLIIFTTYKYLYLYSLFRLSDDNFEFPIAIWDFNSSIMPEMDINVFFYWDIAFSGVFSLVNFSRSSD